jgi:hypothetical protein
MALTIIITIIVPRAAQAGERLMVLINSSKGDRQMIRKRSTYKGSRSEISQVKAIGTSSQVRSRE